VTAGILLPRAILNITTPGLAADARSQAVQIALLTWPSILGTGIILLLTGIYQSQSRFGWPAAVPVIGALVSLVLILSLARRLGIIGLAVANTLGILLQAALLMPLALKRGHYRLTLNWRHPGVAQIFHLLLPLILANVVAKVTPVIDRFFASKMPEGSISHLGYAFRIFSLLSLLISTGISTVIFPRMASDAVTTDLSFLRKTMSTGLRVMWMAIAPAVTIGIALALPLVLVVFRRGQFNITDALIVSALIQIYLLALPPACLGNVTGRGFYALKDTRTVAVLGSIESVAYVFYTSILAKTFGVMGIAFGYVIYFNISLAWQLLILRHKTGKVGSHTVINSFVRTGLAALVGGAVAWGVTWMISNIWLQLGFGSLAGLSVYGISLWLLQYSEFRQVWSSLHA
jgi:putative peptidoglycan lipid II flippase